jgi:type IV pilus assembly protein PilP
MRWLAVIATSTYILIHYPYAILSAADMSVSDELAVEQEATAGSELAFPYRSEGRRDPFETLVKEKPKINILLPEIDQDRPRGPLERFDISALKLMGIVWGELGHRGLIRAPDDKGYFVTVGTYMGENGGQVVDVTPDRLVIEEKYKDTEGNIVGKTLDLPLRRKEKEEQER